MFTSGIIATLFIAYAVILLGRPPVFWSDWGRARILPPSLRRRVRVVAALEVGAVWGVALIAGFTLVDNLFRLGQYALGGPPDLSDLGTVAFSQTSGAGVLLLYILGHRSMFRSDFERTVNALRRKRRERMRAIEEKRGTDGGRPTTQAVAHEGEKPGQDANPRTTVEVGPGIDEGSAPLGSSG